MSEMEYRTGKIQKVKTNDVEKFADEFLKKYLDEGKYKRYVELYDNKVEVLADNFYKEYTLVDGVLYKIIEDNSFDPDDYLAEAKQINEDTFEYLLIYYNGGCSFEEALEDAMNSMEKLNATNSN